MALNLVELGIEYYPDPTKGRPVFFGQIFVGIPDTDPEIPGNQKQITLRQEDGTEVPVMQPAVTGAGGVPIFEGSPVQILVEGNYSLKVLNQAGSQVYYIENAFNGQPLVDGDAGLPLVTTDKMIAETTTYSIGDYVQTTGRLTDGDGGGNIFLVQAVTGGPYDLGSLLASTGDLTIEFLALFPGHLLNVQQFTAVGSGDDTLAIQSALNYLAANGGTLRNSSSTHTVSAKLTCSPTKSIEISGPLTLNFSAVEIDYGLYIDSANAIDSVSVEGIEMSCDNVVAIGIFVDDTNRIAKINIDGNTILDVNNVAALRSTSGIRVDGATTSIIKITGNFIQNVSRVQVNPGVISSSGISVFNLNALLEIEGNSISNVDSPSGDDDADGIVIVGSNWDASPSERQIANPSIIHNRIVNCKGRWVKLIVANASVTGNYFSNVGIELITNFRGVDSQAGACQISGNEMRLSYSVGGTSAALCGMQFRSTGDFEQSAIFESNSIILENTIIYGVIITVLPGATFANAVIESNTVVTPKSDASEVTNFVFTGVEESMNEFSISIIDNLYPAGNGRLFRFSTSALAIVEDAVKGPLFSDTFWLYIKENRNNFKTTNSDIINSSDGIPYLKRFVIGDNSGFSRSGVSLKGVDVADMLEGSDYFFDTDGGAGGLINTPAGYDRFVFVKTEAGSSGAVLATLTKNNASTFAIVKSTDAPAGYEYTGVLV